MHHDITIYFVSNPVSHSCNIHFIGLWWTGRSQIFLRISRILKCLSELGLERLNAGFLLHVLNEQSESSQLNSRAIQESMDRWWANCIREQDEREWIGSLIKGVRVNDGFVFTRKIYEDALERRQQMGN